MNIWNILKIEQTKDKDALKKAYRMRLSSVNPEDDAEGFMLLRKAYEEALRLADLEDENKQEESDTTLSSCLYAIYNDFSKRINPDVWQELFNTDQFISLETGEQAFIDTLRFLMEHVFIPQKVWKLLVNQFDIEAQKQELSEFFPENYIDYILNNAKYDDIINYDCFEVDDRVSAEEIDSYIRDYYDLDRAVRRHQHEQAYSILERMKTNTIKHPYYLIMQLKLELRKLVEDFEEKKKQYTLEELIRYDQEDAFARAYYDELIKLKESAALLSARYPDDITILHFCGDLACSMNEPGSANLFFNHAESVAPNNYYVRAKHAELMFRAGNYKEARDTYMDLLRENHYDNNVRIGMIRSNQRMIEENEKLLEKEPNNMKVKMEIAWSRYQCYQFDQAIQLLNSFVPDKESEFDYYNVLGRSYLALEDYNRAITCFFKWKELIEALPDKDSSEDIDKKRKRYPYVHFLIGNCFLKLKNYTESKKYFDFAMEHPHEEILLTYEALCDYFYLTNNYTDCLKISDELLAKDSRDFIGYVFKAKACEKLNYLQDAFRACEQAISIYPDFPDPYTIKVKILYKTRQNDLALNVIKQFDERGLESDTIDYYRARFLYLNNEITDAISVLETIIERFSKASSDMDNYENVYFLLGFCYERNKEYMKEISAFEHVILLNPSHKLVYGCLATVYCILGQYKRALSMFKKQLNNHGTPQTYIDRAMLYHSMGETEKAIGDFESAILLESTNAFAYSNLGSLYEEIGDFRKAENAYQNALELLKPEQEVERGEITVKLARLLQCMGEYEDSKTQYMFYMNQYGVTADLAYDYSVLLVRMKDIDAAISILKHAIQTIAYNKDIQMCIRRLIEVYGMAGYLDLAHEAYEFALEKDPGDAKACACIGDVFMFFERFDDAKIAYERAIRLDSTNKQNYYSNLMECLEKRKWLHNITKYIPNATIAKENIRTPMQAIKMARLYRVTKKYSEAIEMIQQAYSMKRCLKCFYGNCHEALYEKAKIYEAMKNYEMARKMYAQAIRICGSNPFYEASLKRIQDKK